ncbi:MAG: hypothetical protein PWR06_1478 [Thermoanaerobacteraceae bacterium]|jgi:uncharacterized membrane protein YagU involved in acid resistance|uniref:Uncharacterized protein n=1 Tax=Biomaibacter acetigenes TaxID=2316383 RepID=A0A3G2R298_9FIRM|nr:hypothetical protein [Biomaibacter acetigenes]AYO29258.1 hypothetical protein D2962_00360 [Biomaibacter acetigenes]MDK2878762.1 hypothetical protein [Thermoanaerobacteraceae bacterium]MDN5301856.1 hypothetical protein [Thermoanaerobacteraceae bacterium]MDN5312437.1 hypothetical protein [Thermoanaerobacteraceae bacterium]
MLRIIIHSVVFIVIFAVLTNYMDLSKVWKDPKTVLGLLVAFVVYFLLSWLLNRWFDRHVKL